MRYGYQEIYGGEPVFGPVIMANEIEKVIELCRLAADTLKWLDDISVQV